MQDSDRISHIRTELESLYTAHSEIKSVLPLMSLPDDLLHWMISCLRGVPVPAPACNNDLWSQVLDSLSPHYIIPFLWYNLQNQPESDYPPAFVVERMRLAHRNASIRTLRNDRQITHFISHLNNVGIEPIVLKGPALGHLVYPFPGLRTGSDIDILVHPDQVQTTLAVFQSLDYIPHVDAHAASSHAFHHVTLLPSDRNETIAVEVHWRLLFLPGEITPPLDEMIKRKIEVAGNCGIFHALDIPDAFMYAATHMTIGHSSMIRLSWIADIMYLSRYLTEKNEWNELFKRTSGGVLLAAVKRACKEAAFWFDPDAMYNSPGFFPHSEPGSVERFLYLSAVVGRPERHLIEVFRDAKNIREGIKWGLRTC